MTQFVCRVLRRNKGSRELSPSLLKASQIHKSIISDSVVDWKYNIMTNTRLNIVTLLQYPHGLDISNNSLHLLVSTHFIAPIIYSKDEVGDLWHCIHSCPLTMHSFVPWSTLPCIPLLGCHIVVTLQVVWAYICSCVETDMYTAESEEWSDYLQEQLIDESFHTFQRFLLY